MQYVFVFHIHVIFILPFHTVRFYTVLWTLLFSVRVLTLLPLLLPPITILSVLALTQDLKVFTSE